MNLQEWDWGKILGNLSGVAGALVSLKFTKGTAFERLLMALGGAAFSYYAAPSVSAYLSMPEGVVGFMLGLFGMSILARVWDWWQTTHIVSDFLDAWLRRGAPYERPQQPPQRPQSEDKP